ncbi:MAG: hypothetical protein E3J58_03310 [Actinomycetota bacterium]|nr:MAG: hypothetical protein E3J58_03310 [Actinomycetota bacterium]
MNILIYILIVLEIALLIIAYIIFIFGRKIRKEIKQLSDSYGNIKKTYRDIYYEKLPEPVKKYFKYVLKEGSGHINNIIVTQSGGIRLKENQKWIPFKAVQYFSGQKPGFIWIASASTNPFIWISVRDRYIGQKGNMLIKLFSLFTLINAAGKEMDISSFIRYFSEAPWFPTSLMPSRFLRWEPIDSGSAKALIIDGENRAELIFDFNSRGEIIRVTTYDRYRSVDKEYCKEKWTGYFKDYKEVEGIRIPTHIEAEWNSGDSDFKYIKIDVKKIEFK